MYVKKILLLIPESRKKSLTESLLYKQIVKFFEEEKIRDKFEIAFITINDGVVDARNDAETNAERRRRVPRSSALSSACFRDLPPGRFRGGRLWISKEQIEQMADSLVEYLQAKKLKSYKLVIAYVRGAYLEAVRLANRRMTQKLAQNNAESFRAIPRQFQRSSAEEPHSSAIIEIFTADELAQLKKKGIMWMKVGLRMPTAFIIFRMKMRFLVMEDESKQLSLF